MWSLTPGHRAALLALPFVDALDPGEDEDGPMLAVATPSGRFWLRVEVARSHIGQRMAEHLASSSGSETLLLAPYVGSGIAGTLRQAGVNYADEVGNCFMRLGQGYVGFVQGQRPQVMGRPKSMRAAAFRALFAALVRPDLFDLPLRAGAELAGTSTTTIRALRRRLADERHLVVDGGRSVLVRSDDLAERWAAGWRDLVRPALHAGRFRLPGGDPGLARRTIIRRFGEQGWAWGGRAAADILAASYEGWMVGPRWVIHVDRHRGRDIAVPFDPDPAGELEVMGVPGPLALGWNPQDPALISSARAYVDPEHPVVRPLLLYAELLADGSERSRATAGDLRDRYGALWGSR
jgi:hypothetical protein